MSDDSASGSNAFEGVESGPLPSDAAPVPRAGGSGSEAHPSIPALVARFGDAIIHHEVTAGDQVSVIVEAARVREILEWLKTDADQHYEFLSDLTAVDFGGGRPLQVVYQLWSLAHRRNLRVKAQLPLSALQIDSVEPLWKTADWLPEHRKGPYDDPQKIACNTCHQGAYKPLYGAPMLADYPNLSKLSAGSKRLIAESPEAREAVAAFHGATGGGGN